MATVVTAAALLVALVAAGLALSLLQERRAAHPGEAHEAEADEDDARGHVFG